MGPARFRWRLAFALVILGVTFVAVIATLAPGLRWRAVVIENRILGRSADLPWPELLRMLRPGSGFWLLDLAGNPNPYTSIRNPFTAPPDLTQGKLLYTEHCAGCHGPDGMGSNTGIRLVGHTPRRGRSSWAIYRVLRDGIPGTPMVARPGLGWQPAWQIVAHVEALMRNAPAAAPDLLLTGLRSVAPADIPAGGGAREDWLTYSGSYDGTRYSTLKQITRDNVRSLRVAWIAQLPTRATRVEASPIVRDGVMFVSEPPAGVRALDAATGRTLWSWSHEVPARLSICCWVVNRGVAILGERVFVATIDAHLVALDSRTGAVLWDTKVADYAGGYSITAAPLAVDDMVITGVGGGEFATRGFIDAYDAATGRRRWRFWTIPGAGEPGDDTWAIAAGQRHGGPTWMTGSLDPALGLLYWGVGNPNPDFNGDGRGGDNLYTNSMLALELATGRLRWHFQFTPHDEHDWDAAQTPILIDTDDDGAAVKGLADANRNGFYYLLDRQSGRFRSGAAFTHQTWAQGLTPAGRPVEIPGQRPSKEGTLTWPATAGATNWWSPSYSPQTGFYYVPFLDKGGLYFRRENPDVADDSGMFVGSSGVGVPDAVHTAGVRALEVRTGRTVWEHRSAPRTGASETGGILSTAGGLVFAGDDATFYGLDARSGRQLLAVPLGALIAAAPVSYQVAGRQYVAIAAGRAVVAFSLAD